MNHSAIISDLQSGKKIKHICATYNIGTTTVITLKRKYKLKREYGPRKRDAAKIFIHNGKPRYKSQYQSFKENIIGF